MRRWKLESRPRPRGRARLAGFVTAGLAAGLAGLAPPAGRPAAAQVPAEVAPAWEALVAEHRAAADSAGIVGATLALVRNGEVAAADYFGLADVATGRPVDARTLFHLSLIHISEPTRPY